MIYVFLIFIIFTNKTAKYDFISHSTEFYTDTISAFSYYICTLDFDKDMAKKSAESYVSRKGNDTAISILPNGINVMVVLKKDNA